jgi:hypothetical protein
MTTPRTRRQAAMARSESEKLTAAPGDSEDVRSEPVVAKPINGTAGPSTSGHKSVASAASVHDHADEIEFEFGGPIGSFFVVASLPFVVLGLYYICNKDICLSMDFSSFDVDGFMAQLPRNWEDLFTPRATAIFTAWVVWQVVFERLLPGESVEGVKLPDGKKLTYTMSGHLQFWLSLALIHFAFPSFVHQGGVWVLRFVDPFPLHILYDEYVHLAACAIVFSFALSVFLYVKSFLPGALLAKGGNSGYITYDFFIGRYAVYSTFLGGCCDPLCWW